MKIKKEFTTDLAQETIFEAWVSPSMTVEPVTEIKCDPVPGGVFELYCQSPSGIQIMSGKFSEVIWNEKLVYSWCWKGSSEKTIVEVNFFQKVGITTIIVTHSGFETNESKELHESGWDSYFSGLIEKTKSE